MVTIGLGTLLSPPPTAPTAPPAHHPSRAGPAAAVWRPALAAPGGRHCALVRWGRPRAVARGRQGGWAPAVAKAVPARADPPRVWAPPGTPWQGRRQAGSVGRVGRPQAWAPAGAGWQGVGGRGRVGRREKWLYFSYTPSLFDSPSKVFPCAADVKQRTMDGRSLHRGARNADSHTAYGYGDQ
jgi:hypothetical protein